MKLCEDTGYQQRHGHIKSTSRTCDCGVASFMVVGDKQIYKGFF